MANSRDQSPIETNFKKACYERPDHSDDSNVGTIIGFEDLPIMNLDTWTKQGTLNRQDAPMEKIKVPLYEAPFATVEHPDVVEDLVEENILKGVEVIIGIISNHGFEEEEQIHKMREDLTIQQKSLIEAESKLKSSLDLKKREAEQDLEKGKDHLKILIGSVISFNNV
ncbi:hypothetical protein Cgig2_033927 [Carnegiea gigantea]|uniref:Uncharacterized protein n=1 Tax=Carnegiea gigantea TaxID=171969 RepID=A0A9Q1JKQ7_9CARY|nr:hypothetical protein Cgig2_033927 [Carnegiea gigantea]